MEIDVEAVDPQVLYRTITSVVVPRPIGWISTTGVDGEDNIAPYSFFNAVCSSPPVVMFSASESRKKPLKDTPRNVIDTGEFVCNLVTRDMVKAMDDTSAKLPNGESEFDYAGLERIPSSVVTPPRVAGVAVAMECELYDSLEIYTNTVIFGEVKYLHISDDLLTDGKVDSRKIDAVGRLGGPYYGGIEVLEFSRQY